MNKTEKIFRSVLSFLYLIMGITIGILVYSNIGNPGCNGQEDPLWMSLVAIILAGILSLLTIIQLILLWRKK